MLHFKNADLSLYWFPFLAAQANLHTYSKVSSTVLSGANAQVSMHNIHPELLTSTLIH